MLVRELCRPAGQDEAVSETLLLPRRRRQTRLSYCHCI